MGERAQGLESPPVIQPQAVGATSDGPRVSHPPPCADTCPVSCIHWVTAPQLALLELEMRELERVSVANMMANQARISSAATQQQDACRYGPCRALPAVSCSSGDGTVFCL